MTGFERRGVDMQRRSVDLKDADKKFAYSCKLCTERGLYIKCETCAINEAHYVSEIVFGAPRRKTSTVDNDER